MAKLTGKQERFCREYKIDFNATRAAVAAGYSKKTAHVIGPENLEKPIIKKRLSQLTGKTVKKLELTEEMVLKEMMLIAFQNTYEIQRKIDNGEDLTLAEQKAISGVSKSRNQFGETTTYKVSDKTKGLEMLGKYLAMFKDKLEVSGTISHREILDNIKTSK